jgi:hypothetical protein
MLATGNGLQAPPRPASRNERLQVAGAAATGIARPPRASSSAARFAGRRTCFPGAAIVGEETAGIV